MLADGSVFFGEGIGYSGTVTGEICFNTSMTGYQEILTDPSYAGQIINFTFPHIGIVGTNLEDHESLKPHVRGVIISSPASFPSNFRRQHSLDEWLKAHSITGITGIDTRALTHIIRLKGAQPALIHYCKPGESLNLDALKIILAEAATLEGLDLASTVSCATSYDWKETEWQLEKGYLSSDTKHFRVVAIDFGAKLNILRCLTQRGCEVIVVPAQATAEEILALQPDGIFLSNGPADPAATSAYASLVLTKLIHSHLPIFGICLGHQLLALAAGAKTEKMHQGHRGGNHPVKHLSTGKVEITSQNHGFAVVESSLPPHITVTHRSLFDGTIEGLAWKEQPIFCVQYHPESSPGPHDSRYLFDQFIEYMKQSSHSSKNTVSHYA